MAIEGPLRELALTDVIQLLHLSRKTGTLSVAAERAQRPGLIHFEHGAVIGARHPGDGSRLGHLLVMAGRATESQIEAALALQRGQPTRRIGSLLVETQGVAVGEVQRQLRFQIEETVFDLVRWRDGHFRFEEAPPPPSGDGVRATTQANLRLRSGPGTTHQILDVLPFGTSVSVIGRNASGDWIQVTYQGRTGWVAAWLTTISGGNFNALPVH